MYTEAQRSKQMETETRGERRGFSEFYSACYSGEKLEKRELEGSSGDLGCDSDKDSSDGFVKEDLRDS